MPKAMQCWEKFENDVTGTRKNTVSTCRCFLGCPWHVLSMEDPRNHMATTVRCKLHTNTTIFNIHQEEKQEYFRSNSNHNRHSDCSWVKLTNTPLKKWHMFFVFLKCVPEKTWHEAAALVLVSQSHIAWGLILLEGFEKKVSYDLKICHFPQCLSPARPINFQSLLHLRIGRCESAVALVKPADLVDRWFTLHGVFTDSNPRRHSQCRTYHLCRIYVQYVHAVHVCVDQQSVSSCHWTSASSTWIMFGHSWQTRWAGLDPAVDASHPVPVVLTVPTSAGFCGVQPESLLLKLLEVGLKFRKKGYRYTY